MRLIRRVIDAAMALPSLVLLGCGSVSYKHTVEVFVSDPTHRLGSPPIDVSVFDSRLGTTSDWARKWMGPTSDSVPYRVPFSATAAATAFGPPRPDKVELAVAVPRFEERGFFFVTLLPGQNVSGQDHAGFVPYSDDFKGQAPRLDVQYTATPEPQGWHLVLRLLVPPAR